MRADLAACFSIFAKAGNTVVVPASLADIGGMVALAKGILGSGPVQEGPAASA